MGPRLREIVINVVIGSAAMFAGLGLRNHYAVAGLRVGTRIPDLVWADLADHATRLGPGHRPLDVIEFSDFQCTACRSIEATIAELRRRHAGFAIGYVHYPIERLHPQALGASIASECARDQLRFTEYHDALFNNQNLVAKQAWDSLAVVAGVKSATAFHKCLASEEAAARVKYDMTIGRRIGIAGPPTFVVNGVFRGALSAERLAVLVDSLVAAASSAKNLRPPGG
jgi:protein-disulfide isomerase